MRRRHDTQTYLSPRIAIASLRSIFALKPPLTHCSAAPFPTKRPFLIRCRPVRAAATAPKPIIIGVAMLVTKTRKKRQSATCRSLSDSRTSEVRVSWSWPWPFWQSTLTLGQCTARAHAPTRQWLCSWLFSRIRCTASLSSHCGSSSLHLSSPAIVGQIVFLSGVCMLSRHGIRIERVPTLAYTPHEYFL
jgi:hypothetical protein